MYNKTKLKLSIISSVAIKLSRLTLLSTLLLKIESVKWVILRCLNSELATAENFNAPILNTQKTVFLKSQLLQIIKDAKSCKIFFFIKIKLQTVLNQNTARRISKKK